MRVQVITSLNGYGLSQDANVLLRAFDVFGGIEAIVSDHKKPASGLRFDLNIFLEIINPAFFGHAARNVLVPNPEWLWQAWWPLIPRFSEVWCKTRDAEEIFRGRNRNVRYIGWTSRDRGQEPQPWTRRLLHVAGDSVAKGTGQVIQAMRALPEMHLTLVDKAQRTDLPDNVTLLERVSDQELDQLMCTHKIHLCPSSYEGFGHYINEARSARAVIITTNAAPMNELVSQDYGLGASVISSSRQNMATHKHVDHESLIHMVKLASNVSHPHLDAIGERARAAYLADRDSFHTNLKTALQ